MDTQRSIEHFEGMGKIDYEALDQLLCHTALLAHLKKESRLAILRAGEYVKYKCGDHVRIGNSVTP